MVVSSSEEPLKRECLSTLMFVPATAGLLCSQYVIRDIIENENRIV
jgi:tRNA A37 threonylcarbamoyladenosine dehydratase